MLAKSMTERQIATPAKLQASQPDWPGANASFGVFTAIVIVAKRGITARIAIPRITDFLFMRVIGKDQSI